MILIERKGLPFFNKRTILCPQRFYIDFSELSNLFSFESATDFSPFEDYAINWQEMYCSWVGNMIRNWTTSGQSQNSNIREKWSRVKSTQSGTTNVSAPKVNVDRYVSYKIAFAYFINNRMHPITDSQKRRPQNENITITFEACGLIFFPFIWALKYLINCCNVHYSTSAATIVSFAGKRLILAV